MAMQPEPIRSTIIMRPGGRRDTIPGRISTQALSAPQLRRRRGAESTRSNTILRYGTTEGRAAYDAIGDAVNGFDAQYYLLHNPDVAASGVESRCSISTRLAGARDAIRMPGSTPPVTCRTTPTWRPRHQSAAALRAVRLARRTRPVSAVRYARDISRRTRTSPRPASIRSGISCRAASMRVAHRSTTACGIDRMDRAPARR